MRIRRPAVAAILALGMLVPVVASAPPAQAATCSDFHCDGTDPIRTSCTAGTVNDTTSGYIRNSAGQNLAYLELRWSVLCSTNWGKITRVGNGNYIDVQVYRPSPSANTVTYGGFAGSYSGDQLYGWQMPVCAVGHATDATNPQSPMYSLTICG